MKNDFFKHILLSSNSRQNRTELETETLPYTFTSNSHKLRNYRIYGNTVNGESVGNLVTEGEHAGEYCIPITISRKAKHTATLQLHDCLPSTMQFDAPEALYYAENGLAAGTYNFTIQNYDTAHGGGKAYQFTLTQTVPTGGQLTFSWGYNIQAADAKVSSYASSTSTTAIEQVKVTEGSAGTNLGTTDGNSTNVNYIQRVRYGSNNYGESAIRQFLNSSASTGSVWKPQNKYDRPPSWCSNTAGFMSDIDSDFLDSIGISHKVTILNPTTDRNDSATLEDKFFLLSKSEVYGGSADLVNEGNPYSYYSDYSDLSSPGTGADNNRIKYRNNMVQFWWLRTANMQMPSNTNSVIGNGSFIDYGVASSGGITPACNIELDKDYKYNGRVLHVQDQISVTKGTETLIFDVIGIDCDNVEFETTTTYIYLSEQLAKSGSITDQINYSAQKQFFIDGTSDDITIPALPTFSGTNTLSVGTTIQPSVMDIIVKIKS